MSDERLNELERELARFRPAGLPAELAAALRIEPVEESLTFSDRVLVTFASLGSVAAAVIVAVVVWQVMTPAASGTGARELAGQRERAAVYEQLLAMR